MTNRSSACGTEKSPKRPVGPAALSGPGDEDADCCASLRLARNDTARRLLLIAVGKESPKRLQTLSVTFGDSSPRGRAKSVGPAALDGGGLEGTPSQRAEPPQPIGCGGFCL